MAISLKTYNHLTERKGFIELLEIIGISDVKFSNVLNACQLEYPTN
jgi:hypothetical protein